MTTANLITVTVLQDDDMPAAGAYAAGSALTGHAIVKLNMGLHLMGFANDTPADFRKAVAETLSHELLHACQDILGVALTEAWVEKGMAAARGFLAENPDAIQGESPDESHGRLLDEVNALRAEARLLALAWAREDGLAKIDRAEFDAAIAIRDRILEAD